MNKSMLYVASYSVSFLPSPSYTMVSLLFAYKKCTLSIIMLIVYFAIFHIWVVEGLVLGIPLIDLVITVTNLESIYIASQFNNVIFIRALFQNNYSQSL